MKLQKPLTLLLFSVCIIHLADYIIIPILPIFFKLDKGFTPSEIGFLIGIGAFAFQLGSILGGIISDKCGRKLILLIGAIIEIISLIGLGLSNSYILFIMFQILNGIGGGVFAPTIKAAISEYCENNETTIFSLRGISANLGVAIGGIIPLLFSNFELSTFFIISSIFYSLLFLIAFLIPNTKKNKVISIRHYTEIIKNKSFIFFSIITLFIWSIYIQLRLLLPLKSTLLFDNEKLIGSIWTLTSLFLVVFQTFITKKIIKKIPYFTSIILGVISMGISLFLIGLSHSYIMLLFSAFIFINGEMLIAPPIDSITSKLANKKTIGTYFSINNLSYGLGSGLGSSIGGLLINHYKINNITLWTIFLIISLIISFLIFYSQKFIKIK